MSIRNYIVVLFAGLSALVLSCTDEKVEPLQGDIVGFVKLYDETGKEVANKSGVRVNLDENRYTMTTLSGRFEFNNIEAGTFKLVFEKEGFGTMKKFNFVFTGGNKPGVVSDVDMVKVSGLNLKSYAVDVENEKYVRVSADIDEVKGYGVSFYLGRSSEVSYFNSESSVGFSVCCTPVSSFSHETYIPDDLKGPVYLVVYSNINFASNGRFEYFDYDEGHTVRSSNKKLIGPVLVRQ